MTTNAQNLTPHVREIGLIGATGSGKSLFASNFAAPAARKILKRCVGKGNSTIRDRLLVFTTDASQADKMTVAAKLNRNAVSYSAFQETLLSAAAKAVDEFKNADIDGDRAAEEMRKALNEEMAGKNNLRAVLSLLTDEERRAFTDDLVSWCEDVQLWKFSSQFYNTAKNQLKEKPGKQNAALRGLIKAAVCDWLDQCTTDQKDSLQTVYDAVNTSISQHLFNVFKPSNYSSDGYYYYDLDLQNPDETFCRQFFTANNLRKGETLSLEVLCLEIVVYIPMDTSIADVIRRNSEAAKILSDPRGNLVFGLRDTQGLFHAIRNEDESLEYCEELVYKNTADAILFLIPLEGQNRENALEHYNQVLRNYQKDTPIFLVFNKLDVLIDDLFKDMADPDASTEECRGTNTGLTLQEINEKANCEVKALIREFQTIRRKNGKGLNIYWISCFLRDPAGKLSDDVWERLQQQYSHEHACDYIFTSLGKSLKRNEEKIAFRIDPTEEQTPSVDDAKFRSLLHEHLTSPEIHKAVFVLGKENLEKNIGITPHGNSFWALGRRLRYGDGYIDSKKDSPFFESGINEAYYYNCKNICITFPTYVKNLLGKPFLYDLVNQVLDLNGGVFASPEDRQKFLEAVGAALSREQCKNKWINMLLYKGAFLKASNDMNTFSFGRKFQKFLDLCRPLLIPVYLDEDAYAEALLALIDEAARTVLNLDITFT